MTATAYVTLTHVAISRKTIAGSVPTTRRGFRQSTMKIDVDLDNIQEASTDDRGRLYLGTEYANCRVEIAVLDAETDD